MCSVTLEPGACSLGTLTGLLKNRSFLVSLLLLPFTDAGAAMLYGLHYQVGIGGSCLWVLFVFIITIIVVVIFLQLECLSVR